jgi:hypothetical protein
MAVDGSANVNAVPSSRFEPFIYSLEPARRVIVAPTVTLI